jgi:hypothetical protein
MDLKSIGDWVALHKTHVPICFVANWVIPTTIRSLKIWTKQCDGTSCIRKDRVIVVGKHWGSGRAAMEVVVVVGSLFADIIIDMLIGETFF